MTDYFSSDSHYRHRNILQYQNRPFRDVEHMNAMMINNWNDRVTPEDTVYHLGDFGFGSIDELQSIFDRLNGRKFLLSGNHDKNAIKLAGWGWVKERHEFYIGKQLIVLSHYAMRVWRNSHYGSICLYGHSHGSMPGNSQSLDVGVDCWDYRPVTLAEIQARLKTLPKFIGYREQAGGHDHHRPLEEDSGT
jgi:calcineurin-like phosphoesterase family protein